MNILNINKLYSGGVIVNYYCSSKCKHCVYCSSPNWEKDYIQSEMSEKICDKLLSLGCNSVHIGGGEPMLNLDGLYNFLNIAKKKSMGIDYIETNGSWYKSLEETKKIFDKLFELNVNTIMISVSPYHTEYIPMYKVDGVEEACKKFGMNYFIYQQQFRSELSVYDKTKTHKFDELGENYFKSIPNRYGLSMKGRALSEYKKYMKKISYEKFLNDSSCRELAGVNHFHVDLYGNYVPNCPGISINLDDIGINIDEKQYILIEKLFSNGIKSAYEYAKTFGFIADDEYVSKCDFCYEIRKFLISKELNINELQPIGHYNFM